MSATAKPLPAHPVVLGPAALVVFLLGVAATVKAAQQPAVGQLAAGAAAVHEAWATEQQQAHSKTMVVQVLLATNGTNALGCGTSWATPCASPAFALAALQNKTSAGASTPWPHDISQLVHFSHTQHAVQLILAQGSYNATARIQLSGNASVTIQGPELGAGNSPSTTGLQRTVRATLRCPGDSTTLQSALFTLTQQSHLELQRVAVQACVVLPQGGATTGVPQQPAVVQAVDSSDFVASQCVLADNHGYLGTCVFAVKVIQEFQGYEGALAAPLLCSPPCHFLFHTALLTRVTSGGVAAAWNTANLVRVLLPSGSQPIPASPPLFVFLFTRPWQTAGLLTSQRRWAAPYTCLAPAQPPSMVLFLTTAWPRATGVSCTPDYHLPRTLPTPWYRLPI